MFERFLAQFEITGARLAGQADPRAPMPGEQVTGFAELMGTYSGATFGNGIYRLHTEQSGRESDRIVHAAFPKWARYYCFAYDWLGRQFALHPTDRTDGEPGVARIDFVEHGVQMMDHTFKSFHEHELLEDPNAALFSEMFDEWAQAYPEQVPLQPSQIVGYRIPLSLGGEHELDNLDVVELRVEYDFTMQIDEQITDLPDGTPITGVDIEDE